MEAPDRQTGDDEVFEHIPWSQLSAPPARPRTWIVYVAAGAIAAAAVAAMVVRSWPGPAAESPSESTAAGALPSTTMPPVTLPVPELPVFTEADLMAAVPGESERLAAARAEWFVVDYFSSGGNPAGDPAVVEALPAVAVAGIPEGNGASFVEWAATVEVEELAGQRYRARVLFRMLGALEDGSYARSPVRAVDIVVDVGSSGRVSVADLPSPAALPDSEVGVGWESETAEPPEAVRAAALDMTNTWGGDPEVLQASSAGDLWRVLVGVSDEAGTRWPVALWLNRDGEPTWPEG